MKSSKAEREYCKNLLTPIEDFIPTNYATEVYKRLQEKSITCTIAKIYNVKRGLSWNKEIADEIFLIARENQLKIQEGSLKDKAEKRLIKIFS